jgi:hypothetical protein
MGPVLASIIIENKIKIKQVLFEWLNEGGLGGRGTECA